MLFGSHLDLDYINKALPLHSKFYLVEIIFLKACKHALKVFILDIIIVGVFSVFVKTYCESIFWVTTKKRRKVVHNTADVFI